MVMEALAVDVGAARKEGKEADHGKLLTWKSRLDIRRTLGCNNALVVA